MSPCRLPKIKTEVAETAICAPSI
jgi:hypothetical protein